jgi:hypothetical protein
MSWEERLDEDYKPMTARYALFVMERYYPRGGWRDMQGLFDDLEEAKAAKEKIEKEHEDKSCHIIDLRDCIMVEGF